MSDTQWQELDGEPNTVEAKGRKYTELAEAIARSVSSLQQIVDDTNTTAKSMEKTRTLAGEVREDIEKARERYSYTGEALTTYGASLRGAKNEADPAAAKLRTLRADLEAAQATASSAESGVDDLPKDASDADKADAQRAQTNANNAVTSLQSQITQAEAEWNSGHGDKNAAASTAISKIEEVVSGNKVNGLEDGFWDHAGKAWDSFYKIAKIICDVAGILAIFLSWVPILGQVLVALAAIGAILAIIDSVVKYAKGEIGVRGLVVGVGLGVLSLAGGKIATHLTKVAKLRTVTQSTSTYNAIASARGGAKYIDDVMTSRIPTSTSQKLLSPFVRSDSQAKVLQAFKSGDVGWAGAIGRSTKNAFPLPFKDGMGGVLFRDANDLHQLSKILPEGASLVGPANAAMAVSAATVLSDVGKGMNSMYDAFNGSGKHGGDEASASVGLGSSHAGGSWNTAIQAPNTLFNDFKSLVG
ncbi:hypothetical protein [Promicromonospora aerolata]|uniref:Uncharacterized protein n=1 Tax=Promicromonospora aerolata TaxID=195749 RepID=A0ABW4VBC2_9MICO